MENSGELTATPSPVVCSTNDEEEALTQSERQFGRGEKQTSAMWNDHSSPPETSEEEQEHITI